MLMTCWLDGAPVPRIQKSMVKAGALCKWPSKMESLRRAPTCVCREGRGLLVCHRGTRICHLGAWGGTSNLKKWTWYRWNRRCEVVQNIAEHSTNVVLDHLGPPQKFPAP